MHEKAEVHNTKKNWKKEPKFIKGSSLVCCKFFVKRDAFTLIELLIVVAITAILSTASFLSLSNFRGMQNLRKTVDEVNAVVVGTQKRSMTQDKGNRWNVRFSNSTSTGSQMMVFSSSSYSAGVVDRTYTLNRSILFSEPSIGNIFDASFSPITGVPQSKKIISMWTGRKDGFVGDIIMNTAGLVTKRTDSGFVGYWHMDEGGGLSAYDASGMGNNGTSTLASWTNGSNCISGACATFNGDNRIVFGSNFADNMSAITVTAWVYSTNGGYALGYAAKDDLGSQRSWYFGMNDASSFKAAIWTTTGRTDIIMPGFSLNTWNHVAFVYDGSNMYLYLNGQSTSTPKTGKILSNPGTPVTIGSLSTGYLFYGKLDEIKIYNRALSATEILNQYNDLK